MSDDDAKLVKATLKGDRKSFDCLVERYQRQAVAVTARLLGNLDDALEVAQEGYIRAYRALDQLNEPARFRPWLMRIMTNQALNFRRSRSRTSAVRLDESFGSDENKDQFASDDRLISSEPSPHEQAAAGEMALNLQQAIDELPDNLRTALLLFTVEKIPQKEIADIMKCSLQTVKWSVFEARRRLRARLDKIL